MLRPILLLTFVAGFVSADTLVLKSGRTVEGTYLGGDSRQIRMAVGESVNSFAVGEVSELKFGVPAPAAEPEPAPRAGTQTPMRRRDADRVELMRPDRAPEAAAPARTATVEVPSGTSIVIRMIDDVDSERDRIGQTFRASVDEAVVVNGETLIPRGADVVAKLVDDKASGKLSGRTELTMDIQALQLQGKMVDVNTQEVTTASESRTGQTGKVVGGGAALGAIIGAIAGGGKGAAIGAVTGAGAGAAVQVMTKGQRVKIPSETRLTFTLQQPVRL